MLTYSCKVRLGDNLQNEVRKAGVTAPAIVMLRAIHGGEGSVVDIVNDGEIKKSDGEVRDDLVREYGPIKVQQILGVGGVPLPKEVPGVARKKLSVPKPASEIDRMTA